MFYSQCLLSSKGPLGAIWGAAYFFKKLKKTQIAETNISSSVDKILQDELDVVTYRVLAYLLLGVVRIYSKKVEYLFDDCHKVLIKINDFVVSTKANEHAENFCAPYFSITLPKRFELDAFDLEILEDVSGGNVVPYEQITLKDGSRKNEKMGQYYLDKEIDLCGADNEELYGWSGRTRMAARYLHKTFLNQEKGGEEELVSLSQLLEGRTKKESAKLFYEILVLGTTGYVDVEQNNAYGDIQVCNSRKWDQIYGADDKQSQSWLPERLVDWLADYDCLLSSTQATIHSKLVDFQKELVTLQFIEDNSKYWEVISSALAVGWLDIVVKMLRLHGSYQLDQINNREVQAPGGAL